VPSVLIVDDHAFIRRGIRSILEDAPEWNVSGEAENGRDAVRLAEELKPDVILMDVSMPEMTGLEATRLILKQNPHAKVVLLTLHDSRELVRSAFQLGVNGYLLKTDAERELMRALTIVTGDGTYVSPKIDADFVKRVIAERGPHNVH
jgi:DNA-binding NarL/FixJ family response regulator